MQRPNLNRGRADGSRPTAAQRLGDIAARPRKREVQTNADAADGLSFKILIADSARRGQELLTGDLGIATGRDASTGGQILAKELQQRGLCRRARQRQSTRQGKTNESFHCAFPHFCQKKRATGYRCRDSQNAFFCTIWLCNIAQFLSPTGPLPALSAVY